ncbi:MAG: DNA mismatch repair endonuclease MutL, partial [Desulfuromonadales bacterium]|nr:DNA mismatch repair endonuclease MutL [Desulfuromonadales bacterium]
FRLTHNGRAHLEAYRHSTLQERAAALLGRHLVKDLMPIDAESPGGEMLSGLIGMPGLSRSNANAIYTYINGRIVRDRVVQHAIIDAYRTMLEKRRYPVVVLFIDMPPQSVDVNVHPTKHEVRFRNRQQIHDFLTSAVRQQLKGDTLTAEPPSVATRYESAEPIATKNRPAQHQRVGQVQESLAAFNRQVDSLASPSTPPPTITRPKNTPTVTPTTKREALFWNESEQKNASLPDGWRLIGQFLNSYLVCQCGDELILIDQHAAHERIGFERLRGQLAENGVEAQHLLFPVVLELDHRESELVSESLDQFARLGFDVEHFGGRSFTVKAAPQLLADVDIERLVRDVAAELSEVGRSDGLDAEFERVLSVMACHSMVRANQALSDAEMQRLIVDLTAIDFGSCCPHGRPVMRRLSRQEVERFFHRG